MAKRPINRCHGCGHTWFPRGTDKSAACPKCQGEAITTEAEEQAQQSFRCCCCLLVLVVLVAAFVRASGPLSWEDAVGEPAPRRSSPTGDGGTAPVITKQVEGEGR